MTVEPAVGIELDTVFTLTLSGWGVDALPVSYKFGELRSSACAATELSSECLSLPLSLWGSSNTLSTTLMSNSQGLTLIGRVRDAYGMTSSTTVGDCKFVGVFFY